MWLLSVHTLQLHDVGSQKERYAILSHRWEDEEVTFQDISLPEKARRKKGFGKIVSFCNIVAKTYPDIQYVWVDTCCIDKTNSAELSEAINSMYRWYEQAQICYAYLSDVEDSSNLANSQWFKRGWTLQELLAPQMMEFYNSGWERLGTRSILAKEISLITTIPFRVLSKGFRRHRFSVATRLSWAAHRKTTRTEDLAYCLLGIFDIFMPLIYGEGSRAFQRLQEEILRSSRDLSILAWTGTIRKREGLRRLSPLADDPNDFDTVEYDNFSTALSQTFARDSSIVQLYSSTISSVSSDEIVLSGWLQQCHHRKYILATCFKNELKSVVCVRLRRLPYGEDRFVIEHLARSRITEIPVLEIHCLTRCHIILAGSDESLSLLHSLPVGYDEGPYYFKAVINSSIDSRRVRLCSRPGFAQISHAESNTFVLEGDQTGVAGIVRIDPTRKSIGHLLILGHTFEATEFCLWTECDKNFDPSTPLDSVIVGASRVGSRTELMELVGRMKRHTFQGVNKHDYRAELYEIPNGASSTSFTVSNELLITMENDASARRCTVYVDEKKNSKPDDATYTERSKPDVWCVQRMNERRNQ